MSDTYDPRGGEAEILAYARRVAESDEFPEERRAWARRFLAEHERQKSKPKPKKP